jgi:predicted RNase H-like nuclease (RuvC/YqgF family)
MTTQTRITELKNEIKELESEIRDFAKPIYKKIRLKEEEIRSLCQHPHLIYHEIWERGNTCNGLGPKDGGRSIRLDCNGY